RRAPKIRRSGANLPVELRAPPLPCGFLCGIKVAENSPRSIGQAPTMNLLFLMEKYAGLLCVLFAVGCAASLIRTFQKEVSPKKRRVLKLTEWCLLPPGFALIFITLQQKS